MWKKETIFLLSILLGITISGCKEQVSVAEATTSVEETTMQEEMTTTKEVAVETTQSLLLESEEETTQSKLVASESEIITKENENEELKRFEEKYNGKSYSEIEAMEGWLDDIHKVEDMGYYFVAYQGKYQIMDKETVTKLAEEIYEKDVTGNGIGSMVTKSNRFVEEIGSNVRKKKEQEQAQNFSNVVSTHVKPDGGVALVINDLNPFGINGYTTNSMGYVVPTTESYNYYESLRKNDKDTFKIYDAVDNEVYAKNNQGKVNIIKKYTLPRLSYAVGTVREDGVPLWVQRDDNFEVVNAHGQPFYANCSQTFDDLKVFCGGTTTAFVGWTQFKTYDFSGTYNDIMYKGFSFRTGGLVDGTQDNVDLMGLNEYDYVLNYLNSIGSTIPGRP